MNVKARFCLRYERAAWLLPDHGFLPLMASGGVLVKLLACRARGAGFDSEIGDLLLPSRDMAEMVPGRFAFLPLRPGSFRPWSVHASGPKATQILKTINH